MTTIPQRLREIALAMRLFGPSDTIMRDKIAGAMNAINAIAVELEAPAAGGKPDPHCRICHGTGIDGDCKPDGSVADVDCFCMFKAPAADAVPVVAHDGEVSVIDCTFYNQPQTRIVVQGASGNDVALPPLPEPFTYGPAIDCPGAICEQQRQRYFSVNQMHDYARATVAALQATVASQKAALIELTVENERWAKDANAKDDAIRERDEARDLADSLQARINALEAHHGQVRTFLDVAAGEGMELGGVDAGDLYVKMFGYPQQDTSKEQP